ncbi:MAG: dATP/dGTP diphosphohydrolase domain-containing protein [Egibacteraceae bacterium]
MRRSKTAPKPSNPKDAIGSTKIPYHVWPEVATILGAMKMLAGALKYGRSNYRAIGIRATIYTDAIRRHTNDFLEGEDLDPEDGLHHMAGVLASAAIILDAYYAGKMIDDRMYPGGYKRVRAEMTAAVTRLKKLYAGRNPKHWTIADAPRATAGHKRRNTKESRP